ncbi:MAG: type III toxin-antitoxin system ToxN/AbiQ family toxin [Anaeroplasmataceae bacterium]
MLLEFNEFMFVYIKLEYLKALYNVDKEIFYVNNSTYEKKPHLGMLITCDNINYVIPLTSAKNKHRTWNDVTATNYIIYEIINEDTTIIDKQHYCRYKKC